jgi:ABC-type dipeptide/oligopeptide/nickel transport system permease component
VPPVLYLGQMLNVYTYKSNWWGFISKRFLGFLAAIFVVTLGMFYTLHYSDNNYWLLAPVYLTSEEIPVFHEQVNKEMHVGSPFIVKYGYWLKDLVTGNLGYSFIKFE